MKYYWFILGIILPIILWFGFVGPYCMSSDNTIIVFLWVLFTLTVYLPLTIKLIRRMIVMMSKNKKPMVMLLLLVGITMITQVGCSKVPAGNVGIKFYLYGTNKGVDYDILKPGKYWIGYNEELYLFPTFTQNIEWTKDKDKYNKEDQSFNFQDRQGLELNADIGITYHLNSNKIPEIFQKYKKGIDEITDIYLKNMVRDALVNKCSKLDVEYIYGEGREDLLKSVCENIKTQCEPTGIEIEKLYWIGRIKLPASVKAAIDSKINA